MCSDIRRRVLLVSEDRQPVADWSGFDVVPLTFEFTDSPPPDIFAAWAKSGSSGAYWVSSRCRPLVSGFASQVLNRFVARELLAQRVDALVVTGLFGCTLDLPRMASLMGVPVVLHLDASSMVRLAEMDPLAEPCLMDSLKRCLLVAADQPCPQVANPMPPAALPQTLRQRLGDKPAINRFHYATYEFSLRDHPLLSLMQAGDVRHFENCGKVLDLACGVGIFLDLLRQRGIDGVGVERNPEIADYGRGMGLPIVTDDALTYLARTEERYDGIYCAHFVEHLTFDAVQGLMRLLVERLAPGGTLVLVFPDPESIRSQLLGFWRDPEHVRFYHPELIISLASAEGLQCVWTSYDEQPHDLVPFSLQPPEVPSLPPLSPSRPGFAERLLGRLGLVSRRRLADLEQTLSRLTQQQSIINARLSERTEALWAVNRTWGWNDNVTVKLIKPHG